MSIDKLRDEQREYTLRIEEVLSGMDRVLTDLTKRVVAVERRAGVGGSGGHADPEIAARVESLEEQVATLGHALNELLVEHDRHEG